MNEDDQQHQDDIDYNEARQRAELISLIRHFEKELTKTTSRVKDSMKEFRSLKSACRGVNDVSKNKYFILKYSIFGYFQ